MVKPKHLEPRPEGSGSIGRHPAVVVSNPNDQNRVKVAVVSHSHPGDPPTKPAKNYANFPVHPTKGESSVDVGMPKAIAVGNVNTPSQEPTSIGADKLALLKGHINENCSDGEKLTRRSGVCMMKPKKKTPPPAVANKKGTATKVTSPAKKVGRARKPAKMVGGARKPRIAASKKKTVGRGKAGTRKPTTQPKKHDKTVGGARKPAAAAPKKLVSPSNAGRKPGKTVGGARKPVVAAPKKPVDQGKGRKARRK